jgi:hypothetical protein
MDQTIAPQRQEEHEEENPIADERRLTRMYARSALDPFSNGNLRDDQLFFVSFVSLW